MDAPPTPPRAGRHPLLALVFLPAGALIGLLAPPEASGWSVLGGLVAGWIVAVAVHELGHVIVGRLAGMRLMAIGIGPLLLMPHTAPRLRPSTGGLAALLPPPGWSSERLRRRFRAMTAGGPLIGLVASAVMAGAAVPVASPDASAVLGVAGGMGLMVNAAALIPHRSGGLRSDGARLLRLRPGAPGAASDAALLALAALMPLERPREWPDALIDTAVDAADGPSERAAARQLAAMAAEDRGDGARARALLDAALAEPLPPDIRAAVELSMALRLARAGDGERARALLDGAARAPLTREAGMRRLRAEVLLAEGRLDEARSEAARVRSSRDAWPWEIQTLGELEARLGVA